MSETKVNYTDEAVARLNAVYDGNDTEANRDAQVAQLAEELGKSAASIRAKLTRERLYVPKAKAPAGKATVSKAALVQAIADAIDEDVDVIGSLEKATKVTLAKVLRAVAAK
jgi:hypothetical protein